MSTVELTVDTARTVLSVVDAGLVNGLGTAEPGKMCVEAAVCFALGLPHSDAPPCVGAAVRSFKIRLNDSGWSSNDARGKGLRRIAIAQLGSNEMDQQDFAKRLAEQTIRQIVPIALRSAAKLNPAFQESLETAALRCEKEGSLAAAADAAYAADAADAARAAYAARAARAERDRILTLMAEIGVSILQEMGSHGCQWLYLTEQR